MAAPIPRRPLASVRAARRRCIPTWAGPGRTPCAFGACWATARARSSKRKSRSVSRFRRAAAVGASVPVASADGLTLALKGSGEAARYSVKDNGSATAAQKVETQRLRVAAEARRTWTLPGGTLTPSLEVGARWDGGDGETGAGVELGGGLEWVSGGLSVEARGRALVAHEGGVEEWGVSGAARLSPGSGPRAGGLSRCRRTGGLRRAASCACGTKGWRAALRLRAGHRRRPRSRTQGRPRRPRARRPHRPAGQVVAAPRPRPCGRRSGP